MKEIKSTIVGIILILLGTFFIYSDRVDVASSYYLLIGCFGLIVIGLYFLFTTKDNRGNHMKVALDYVKNKSK